MNSIRWGQGAREMAICPWWQTTDALVSPSVFASPDPDHEWVVVEVRSTAHAHSLLGQDLQQIGLMRHMLATQGCTSVSRMSDHQVAEDVAQKLAHRQLRLFNKVLTTQGKERLALRTVLVQAVAPSSAASPSSFVNKTPQEEVLEQAAAQLANDEDFASVEQDAQAATLRKAAVSGVPFCEVCERLKRERELAAASAHMEAA